MAHRVAALSAGTSDPYLGPYSVDSPNVHATSAVSPMTLSGHSQRRGGGGAVLYNIDEAHPNVPSDSVEFDDSRKSRSSRSRALLQNAFTKVGLGGVWAGYGSTGSSHVGTGEPEKTFALSRRRNSDVGADWDEKTYRDRRTGRMGRVSLLAYLRQARERRWRTLAIITVVVVLLTVFSLHGGLGLSTGQALGLRQTAAAVPVGAPPPRRPRPASRRGRFKANPGSGDAGDAEQAQAQAPMAHVKVVEVDLSDDPPPSGPPRAPLPGYVHTLARDKSQRHRTLQSGLLELNEASTLHPVHQLIHDARREWDRRVAKQSRTLKEAVQEYKHRYDMDPPRGFDKWWAYVVENNVPMPDEYDIITRSLRPFRAYSPSDLRQSLKDAMRRRGVYTVHIRGGVPSTTGVWEKWTDGRQVPESWLERVEKQLAMLAPVLKHLPDMDAVHSADDGAQVVIGFQHRTELDDKLEERDYYEADTPIDTSVGWKYACSPSSVLRRSTGRQPRRKDRSTLSAAALLAPPPPHSFIASHQATFDPCTHPYLLEQHGMFIKRDVPMQRLLPIIGLSKTELHADILGLPSENWVSEDRFPVKAWHERTDGRLMWRGSNTGSSFRKVPGGLPPGEKLSKAEDAKREKWWWESHRLRMIRVLQNETGVGEVLATPAQMLQDGQRLSVGEAKVEVENAELAERLDIKFARGPTQCGEDGTCAELEATHSFYGSVIKHEDAPKYKYILDIDGNGWSARFQRSLMGGSLIYKATITPEWWNDRAQAWVHYVPVGFTYKEIHDIHAFFTEPEGDALAEQIANEGRTWATTHWRKADMTAYMFRLYLEWARLTAADRTKANFVYDAKMERRRRD